MFRTGTVNNLQANEIYQQLQMNPVANQHELELLAETLKFFYFVRKCQPSVSPDVVSNKLDLILKCLQNYAAQVNDTTGAHAFCTTLIKREMDSLLQTNSFYSFYHTYHTDLKKYLSNVNNANKSDLTPTSSPTKLKG
jgi:hypothetical protein